MRNWQVTASHGRLEPWVGGRVVNGTNADTAVCRPREFPSLYAGIAKLDLRITMEGAVHQSYSKMAELAMSLANLVSRTGTNVTKIMSLADHAFRLWITA